MYWNEVAAEFFLTKTLKIYAKTWINDFGEGHLFLAIREELILFEYKKELYKIVVNLQDENSYKW